ncbi:PLD nuclease N-terminal domain-containing protein [Clavibacter sepedonicus]|uniref:PLD nuclease N-terminal domain-containing protein n=1 Tax=Clavibacter TaxID=1573 RepID=UPI000674712C|nr:MULTISPECIES: PLD nuclease N-terminal domain-containing protein [Clavibacter]MBD5382065.1 PLDc_N domain-containing protein [Clavibacter sp.]OQJ48126.1 hypothetical protein B5P19_07395 [Clavibacter sepedonicus]OQJ54628.1 hypothetical protein B5P20_11385 [Clavibacter sepedonicus]UUK66207.1 PLD nuclease N-terminal domain-containing protein [Clavibacter sepedonicus]
MPFYDAFWSVAIGTTALLAVIALIQVVRRRSTITTNSAAIWIIVILIAPIVGALMWFLVGNRTTPSHSQAVRHTHLGHTDRSA